MTDRKKILVTGGAGFIGSHLCRALLEQGNEVICLDNLLTGTKEHIADMMGDPLFSFVEADVTEPFDADADQIYHLACPASPVHYQEDPIYTAKTCFLGALHVLELAQKNHARILLTSTSEVYGDPAIHPQPESYRGNVNPIGPRACYDEGKRIAETLFFDAQRVWGTDIRVVRIFNTYGPGMEMDDGRIVSNFINQALRGDPVTIYGDGSQTRSFCYVSDMVRGIILMMESETCVGPLNLGNPQERTVFSAAEEIIRRTGSQSPITYHPLPVDDPTRRQPDISMAKRMLGWRPEVSFAEGIEETIRFFKEEMGKEQA